MFALFVPHAALPFTAAGALIGMAPSILAGVPSRVTIHTPRLRLWAEFTRQWVHISKYRQKEQAVDVWRPDKPIWRRGPGNTLSLRLGEDLLEVRGARRLREHLKHNFDRISARPPRELT